MSEKLERPKDLDAWSGTLVPIGVRIESETGSIKALQFAGWAIQLEAEKAELEERIEKAIAARGVISGCPTCLHLTCILRGENSDE